MTRFDVTLRRQLIRAFEGGLKRRPVFGYWAELESSQWWAAERLASLRLDRLRALIQHARDTSPWYRDRWATEGLGASSITEIAELARFPIVDRDDIVAHRLEMRSTAPGMRLIAKATGGSSGVPLKFDLDHDSNERRMAAWHRGYGWAGAGPGTRQWYLWGVPPDSTAGWRKQKVRLYDRLYRRTTMSCFELGESTLRRFAASLAQTRPDAIVAYTGALYAFARLLEAEGIVPYRPSSLVVGAEALHDFQRETIERVFRAPVFETYGSREFMLIGAECPEHAGLHLTAEHHLVELVDAAGQPVADGIEGDMVITDLTNFGMPFIRYRNGDRGIMATGACACGRHLPRLARVTGRRLDVLTTPDGHELPGEFFPHIMKEFASVQRFQVVQEVADEVLVRIVAPTWSAEDAGRLAREVGSVAGGQLRVRVETVDDIPLTGAGKLKVVVNRLAERARQAEAGVS
ncbi:MAG: phenylacetate--CoA ligase family protein [Gemmatimonadota bacterium]